MKSSLNNNIVAVTAPLVSKVQPSFEETALFVRRTCATIVAQQSPQDDLTLRRNSATNLFRDLSSVSQNTEKFSSYTFDAFAEYQKTVFDNHKFKLTAGGTLHEANGEGLFATGYDVPYNSWEYADIALAKEGHVTHDGSQKLVLKKGVEVGNIFQLGCHYSTKMANANITKANKITNGLDNSKAGCTCDKNIQITINTPEKPKI